MPQSSESRREILTLVNELVHIFSDAFKEKEKLRMLIERADDAKLLFDKLLYVVEKYEKIGENIKDQINFHKQLEKFKNLLEDNLKKSTQNQGFVLLIDDYLSAIRDDYKLIRNYIQTLEDINTEIKNKLDKKQDKSKIGQLIICGVNEKIPNLIYFQQNKTNDEQRKMTIVNKFYDFFVKYIFYVQETLTNPLDDNQYRLKLENLQLKLLQTKPNDIKYYFSLILEKISSDSGYSTEVLLQFLAKIPMVHRHVSNNSEYYVGIFIEFSNKLANDKIKFNDKKCIEALYSLVFKFDYKILDKLLDAIVQDDKLIDLVFKSIYNIGIQLYLNEINTMSKESTGQEIKNHFQPTARKHLDELKGYFIHIFTIISTKHSDVLNKLRDSIIDEKNAPGTFQLLTDIYGQCIKYLSLTDEIINVKYCFNYCYFKSLTYPDLDDVPGLSVFYQLLFYIPISDNTEDERKDESIHKFTMMKLKRMFLRVYNKDSHGNLTDLVEVLKIMINIGTSFRRSWFTEEVLLELENQQVNNQTLNVTKNKLLKMFLRYNHLSKICLRLAQTFNLHLLKGVYDDNYTILQKLYDENSNFKLFVEKLKDFKKEFNINNELTPGFSVPYYLSIKLLGDDRCNKTNSNYNEENNKTVMSILFRVFTCSSDEDKKEFLKEKTNIYNEFLKLFESVSRFIKFYYSEKPNAVYKELQAKSIEYMLDGFNATHKESLKERYDRARDIIDNFINYDLKYIDQIINSSSKTDILTIFDVILKRHGGYSLQEWTTNTSKLGDKMYFLYCYHKYSEREFDQWLRDLNPNTSDVIYNVIKEKRDLVKEELGKNMKAFELINIKYLQHNQIGALALIYEYLEDSVKNKNNNNLFIKIGTGQGKSLTIAETARKIIELNRRHGRPKQQIFIVTCYDHLAERDYKNYINYYKYFSIKSMYCSRQSSTKNINDNDVIYVNLETYFDLLRSEGYKTLTDATSIHLPNLDNAVLIMDEFDSLILDSDEICQCVHYFDLNFHGDVKDIRTNSDIKKLFDTKFIDKFETKFPNVFKRWCSEILNDRRENISSIQDSLGKDTTLAQPFLVYLSKYSKGIFVHFYLDPLTFYSKFKQVIGFSGSITETGRDGMNKFTTLFEGKQSIYYEIPPFFGLSNLEKNRTFANNPGEVIRNRVDFLEAIHDEIRKRYLEQPILIFADSLKREDQDKSDYDYIYESLTDAKNSFLKDSTIIKIKSEFEINENIHKIGKLGSITLATRIIARGADIKVDKHIEKGLHLILTYYPKRENIYIQMLGRTARQDEKGSYSEIVQLEKKFIDVHEVKIDSKAKKIHDTTEYFYKKVSNNPKIEKIKLSWPLFSTLIQYLYTDEIQKYDFNTFIDENFL